MSSSSDPLEEFELKMSGEAGKLFASAILWQPGTRDSWKELAGLIRQLGFKLCRLGFGNRLIQMQEQYDPELWADSVELIATLHIVRGRKVSDENLASQLIEECDAVWREEKMNWSWDREYLTTMQIHWRRMARDLSAKQAPKTDPTGSERRVSVDTTNLVVTIDGVACRVEGGKIAATRLAEYIQDLIDADGDPVERPPNLKSPELKERQPKAIRDLIKTKRGYGTFIPRDRLRT